MKTTLIVGATLACLLAPMVLAQNCPAPGSNGCDQGACASQTINLSIQNNGNGSTTLLLSVTGGGTAGVSAGTVDSSSKDPVSASNGGCTVSVGPGGVGGGLNWGNTTCEQLAWRCRG